MGMHVSAREETAHNKDRRPFMTMERKQAPQERRTTALEGSKIRFVYVREW